LRRNAFNQLRTYPREGLWAKRLSVLPSRLALSTSTIAECHAGFASCEDTVPTLVVLSGFVKPEQPGEHVRCVVSVAMLNESWDANNVTHILGIRAFGSQLLCEQVIGRGLRRLDYRFDAMRGMLKNSRWGVNATILPGESRNQRPIGLQRLFGLEIFAPIPFPGMAERCCKYSSQELRLELMCPETG
jgi:hypothetical protein